MALVVAVAVSSVADASLCVVTTESLSQRFAACSVAFKSTAESDGATDLKTGNLGSGNWRLSVDDSNAGGRQRISGFGAAWTDTTVAVFDSLSAERQATLLEQLFGESGIGLSVMRHTIGQSDLTPPALGRWSFDENGGEPDPTLQQFNLTAPGERMLSWLRRMRAASSRRVLLLGSPWSPPAWMKQDNTLQWQYVDAWVQYMLTYLRTYRKAGVAVDAITPQNEPLHSADGAWTMRLDASYQSILVSRLGSALRAAGERTAIWAFDHNTDRPDVPQAILNDSAARPYVAGVAWHCYADRSTTPDPWAPMSAFHQANPHVPQYMSECWTHLQSEGFFGLPAFIGGPVRNYGQAALAWTLGGSVDYDVAYPGGCAPCSGIVQVNRTAGVAQLTQDYYTLGHFSKHLATNATYHSSEGSYIYPDGTGVQATAFVNPDGSRVLVVENKIHDDLTLHVGFSSGDEWVGATPARSITTWLLPPNGNTNARSAAA